MMDKADSTIKGSIVSTLAELGYWPFANIFAPARPTYSTGSLPHSGIIHKAISVRNTISQLGLGFARTSAFAAHLDHETPFCGFGRKIFHAYQASPSQDAHTLGGEYIQEASPPKSTVSADSSLVSHQSMISGCTYAERTDSEYAGKSDIFEYEDGLDCEAFDNTDFLWEETNYIGVKGLLEYLKDDIIQQIHYDMHSQADDIASQPILIEGNSEHHTITRLNIQAYNDEVYGDRPGDVNKDDHQAPTHSITRQNLFH
ncbi:hypothetical protein CSIM01_01073 [Colletotrichum simmondsii]|uniref:Uncharacterized protein n=1 Tax=Colletotrichum simmondsii TaxID=703756 RepID=A0A135S0B5_9PEZI|nr:hypothetical protein CSIM01_01073 [Colletotrichum simmondsii]